MKRTIIILIALLVATGMMTDTGYAKSTKYKLSKLPQINGPKKAEPNAPHEIPRIATMVSGFFKAIIMEIKTKIAEVHRI